MSKTFTIGQKFDNGIIIVDGPFAIEGSRNRKYMVRCAQCGDESLRWSNSIKNLKYGCKKCYDRSMRRSDERPAIKRAFISLCTNAKSRGIDVEITEDQYYEIARHPCHWCDGPPSEKLPPKPWQKSVMLSGVDRVNNELGYTLENSVASCYPCNRAKSDMSIKEWNDWRAGIAKKFVS